MPRRCARWRCRCARNQGHPRVAPGHAGCADLGRHRALPYEFAFIGGPLKIRGGDAAPLRPVALPVRP
ncbi:hypothetical protein C7E18_20760 [Stenotrophomonas maltophilia]|nr:hypothetical protein C7E18_20760 [Stenotrophomonas maltophilia]